MALPPPPKRPKISTNPLNDCLMEIQKRADEDKRHRAQELQRDKMNNISTIAQLLAKVEEVAKRGFARGSIEVEARFGVYQTNEFNSSITSKEMELLAAVVKTSKDPEFQFLGDEHTVDFSWKPPPEIEEEMCNYRITEFAESEDGTAHPIRTEKKKRLSHPASLAFPHQQPPFPYQVRISAASEEPCHFGPHQMQGHFPVKKREKSRHVYACIDTHDAPPLLQLHLTTVRSSNGTIARPHANLDPHTTYEVELELSAEAMDALINQPDSAAQVQKIARRIYKVIEFIQHQLLIIQTDPFPDIFAVKLNYEEHREVCESVRRRVSQCFRTDPGDDFPGSMPVTLSRKYYNKLKNAEHPYYVSEKTDGVRYLLFIGAPTQPLGSGVFLIDRAYTIYQVVKYEDPRVDLRSILAIQGDTLIDGEMIRHHGTKKPYFMVFDLICLDGDFVGDELLAARLVQIGEYIIKPFRLKLQALDELIPFDLIGKRLVPIEMGFSVLKCIRTEKHERFYQDDKRFHKTDGIIFTPGGPYQIKTSDQLFKWKYQDLQTIDFLVKFPHGEAIESTSTNVELYISGGSNDILCKVVSLLPEDYIRLKQDLISANLFKGHSPGAIAEMSFDVRGGRWRYHSLRLDKPKPNYIRVAWDTMEAIAENITFEEIQKLIYEFQKKAQQHHAMKAQADAHQ